MIDFQIIDAIGKCFYCKRNTDVEADYVDIRNTKRKKIYACDVCIKKYMHSEEQKLFLKILSIAKIKYKQRYILRTLTDLEKRHPSRKIYRILNIYCAINGLRNVNAVFRLVRSYEKGKPISKESSTVVKLIVKGILNEFVYTPRPNNISPAHEVYFGPSSSGLFQNK